MAQGSNFVDYVKVCCRSGHGGAGSAHLHRDKHTATGGPDGGDGGRGGHIILKGTSNLWTLLHLKYRKHIIASNGESGGSSLRTGATGRDEILEVPLGTIAKDAETGEILFDITEDGETKILVPGGYTPNGEGVNDKFILENTGTDRIDLEVFNRWGNVIFKAADYKNDWEGTSTQGIRIGDQVPDGTYYYVIMVNNKERLVGYITIKR